SYRTRRISTIEKAAPMWPRCAVARTSTIVRRSSRERASSGCAARSGPVREACIRVSYLFDEVSCPGELRGEKPLVDVARPCEPAPVDVGRDELVEEDQGPLQPVERIEGRDARRQRVVSEHGDR